MKISNGFFSVSSKTLEDIHNEKMAVIREKVELLRYQIGVENLEDGVSIDRQKESLASILKTKEQLVELLKGVILTEEEVSLVQESYKKVDFLFRAHVSRRKEERKRRPYSAFFRELSDKFLNFYHGRGFKSYVEVRLSSSSEVRIYAHIGQDDEFIDVNTNDSIQIPTNFEDRFYSKAEDGVFQRRPGGGSVKKIMIQNSVDF